LSCETDRRLFIEWERKNDTIPNRTSGISTNVLTLVNLKPEDAGDYRCVVSDPAHGSCDSSYARITINGNYPYAII